ncbi:MAG: acetyl-CoA carboxylase biotin carboxyl carrier protein subunit [Acidobacteriota bacterium]
MTAYSSLNIDETVYETEVPSKYRKPFSGIPDPREVRAFIPGVIAEIRVRPGQRVREKDVLLLLEAMKMFNEVCSQCEGVVVEILVKPGDRVEKDQMLLRIR